MSLLIKNGIVVTEESTEIQDILIEGDAIVKIAPSILESEAQVIDAKGKYVLPGAIDAHVHYKMAIDRMYTIDNFETGSKAALCGGVTTVIDYGEPVKNHSMVDSMLYRIKEGAKHQFVDYSIHMTVSGAVPYTKEDLQGFKDAGINSLKLYTVYGFILDYENIINVLRMAKEIGLVTTIHAEDNEIVAKAQEQLKKAGKTSVSYHSESRPVAAEVEAVRRLIEVCEKEDLSVHIVHVSAGSTGELIEEAKKRGVKISAETCPHYLVLNSDVYQGEDPQLYVMQPPLRNEEERQKLLGCFERGVFDFVTTDHCSYSFHQKFSGDQFYDVNGGIPGTETLVPIVFSEGVSKGRFSVEKFVELIATNPSKKFGLYPQKGTLKVGSDGDIMILDPEKEVTLCNEGIHSASDYTPFNGFKVKGYPVTTIKGGKIAFTNGKFQLSEPEGKFIKSK